MANIWELYDLIEEDTNQPDREYLDWYCDDYPEDTQEEEEAEYDWLTKEDSIDIDDAVPFTDFITIQEYRARAAERSRQFWSNY